MVPDTPGMFDHQQAPVNAAQKLIKSYVGNRWWQYRIKETFTGFVPCVRKIDTYVGLSPLFKTHAEFCEIHNSFKTCKLKTQEAKEQVFISSITLRHR